MMLYQVQKLWSFGTDVRITAGRVLALLHHSLMNMKTGRLGGKAVLSALSTVNTIVSVFT
jgi:hypothetical protein